MTTVSHSHSADFARHEARSAQRTAHVAHVAHAAAARGGHTTGLGGKSIAGIVLEHCEGMAMPMGVIIEYLDAQAGTWQYASESDETWRTIRTDLINRPGNTGLALERTARLRVLPMSGGPRSATARMVFHATQRAPDDGGSYQTYPAEDRGDDAASITLMLTLRCINGTPPTVATARPRNKRALAAQRSTA